MNTAAESEADKDVTKKNTIQSLFTNARSTLRDLRLTSLGLWEKSGAGAQDVLENIRKRSAEKVPAEADSSENAGSGLGQRAKALLVQAKTYGVASYEEAVDARHQFSDWLIKAYNEAGTAVETSDQKAISRLGRTMEQTSKTLNELAQEIRESTLQLLDTAKEEGKELDYELRKALFSRQVSLASRVQAFWAALGLVSKQEMKEMNRKLVVLAESLENHLDEESKNLVYLNRRKQDRRVKHVPVAFDKRLRDRREQDRLAS